MERRLQGQKIALKKRRSFVIYLVSTRLMKNRRKQMKEHRLNLLIPKYGELKEKEKELKKEVGTTNASIKNELKGEQVLHAGDKVEFEAGGYIAVLAVQDRSVTNADKLLRRMKELGFTEAIETVEMVKTEVVESLIYEGHLSAVQIEDCVEVKEVETLTIKKVKAKK